MKIMWFANIMFPEFAKELNLDSTYTGGWMYQFKNFLSNDEQVEFAICSFSTNHENIIHSRINNTNYYLIPKSIKENFKYDDSIETYIKEIIHKESPDLIHIWGTEFPHTLSIQKVANSCQVKTVISLQGLIFDIARHYCDGLNNKQIHFSTLRDMIRNDNIYQQMKKFEMRGEYEKEALKLGLNVIGRTIYDHSCAKEINPNISYYKCNECLRNSFYENEWNIENIERESIFISQASYPIKGFHIFLDALKIVKNVIPNVKVYVAGGFNPFVNNKKAKLLESSYSKIIREKILEFNLKENIEFVGSLSEKEMCEKMLKSHVFVSPSTIENSPNSVGEAMLIGLPVISSFVGGVSSMIENEKSGLLYQSNQPNVLANYIIELFKNDSLCLNLSNHEKIKASNIYDIDVNINTLKNIYVEILK